MPKLTINGIDIEVPQGATVMQACQAAEVEVPHFCYHERLDIAGNCRMCLVQMEGAPKPIASCAMPAADGMKIITTSDVVKKARNGVMEFLLMNHPLDCPICDQGGECDLQDQAMAYGFDSSRYREEKRAVKDKYMGPLIKTHMTRCIHCTRCIRFIEDVAGVEELGAVNRGEKMEVSTYVEKALTSELSANIIDLCPVGALTSKPYAFKARPWEMKKTESIDVLDAVGSNIRIDSRGNEVLRVLPRLHEDVNEEWISDKTRYACDGLLRQRLDRPYVRKGGTLRPATWDEAFAAVQSALKNVKGREIAALAGNLCDSESMYALKRLMRAMGSPHTDCRIDGMAVTPDSRADYLFNTTIAGIENADAILLIGTNPRVEAPLIQARILKRYRAGGLSVALVGEKCDLTHHYTHLGHDPKILADILNGKNPFAATLKEAKNPMVIVGAGALTRKDGEAVHAMAKKIAETFNMVRNDWNGFNVLHMAASRVGALDLEFLPAKGGFNATDIIAAAAKGEIKVLYLLGADDAVLNTKRLDKCFVIYQGHHGDAGATIADVILPAAAYTEKDGLYVNTEGRVQNGVAAIFPVGEAKEDWAIIRALSERVGHVLPFDTLSDLRTALAKEYPVFATCDQIVRASYKKAGKAVTGKLTSETFTLPIKNFYMTDVISRASETMARCTRELVQGIRPDDREAA